MEKIKYYYGKKIKLALANVVLDEDNNIIDIINIKPSKYNEVPRITICGVIDTDAKLIKFGVALCSKNDVFNKKIGRRIAYKRAINHPYRICSYSDLYSTIFMNNCRIIEQLIKSTINPKF